MRAPALDAALMLKPRGEPRHEIRHKRVRFHLHRTPKRRQNFLDHLVRNVDLAGSPELRIDTGGRKQPQLRTGHHLRDAPPELIAEQAIQPALRVPAH